MRLVALLLLGCPLCACAQRPASVHSRAVGDTTWMESSRGTLRTIQRGDTLWLQRATVSEAPVETRWVLHGQTATAIIGGKETSVPAHFITGARTHALKQIDLEAAIPELRRARPPSGSTRD